MAYDQPSKIEGNEFVKIWIVNRVQRILIEVNLYLISKKNWLFLRC